MALPMVSVYGHLSRTIQRVLISARQAQFLPLATCRQYSTDDSQSGKFDEALLEILVCPLSKKPLRYDKEKNELISETVGVAFPIVNGIPNLVPQDGRMLTKEKPEDQPQS